MNLFKPDIEFLKSQIQNLTDESITLLVSEWAAQKRVLPKELTSHHGPWDNDYTPYLVKIMDALSPHSPTRKVAILKGAGVGCSTGVSENFIGYKIDENPSGILYINADATLAARTLDLKIDRLIDSCNLGHKIGKFKQGSKKTGVTSEQRDFNGGFLLAYGARSPSKLRDIHVDTAIAEEFDGWPDTAGKEGTIEELFENRTIAFENTRKILFLSTPTILQTSKIYKQYLKGDQQHFYVPCPDCGHMQYLRLQGTREDGKKFAFHYEVDEDFNLIIESVHYKCEACLYPIKNHEKEYFLKRGEWRPTAKPTEPNYESFWLPSFYAPVGNRSWETICLKWLNYWDERNQRVKDIESYKTFKNTVEGLPFEDRGGSIEYEKVRVHRRAVYLRNEIKNKIAIEETGSRILVITCAADVHKDRIDCEILGWCKDGRTYSIDWRHLEGDTEDHSSVNSPWVKLSKIVEEEFWTSDDGIQYRVDITFVDAGYRTDEVYQFTGQYSEGVYCVFGRDSLPKNFTYKTLFHESKHKHKFGGHSYSLNVNTYKDRLASWMRRDWNNGEIQPFGFPNYPNDYGDDYFRMYEAETKEKVYDKKTGKYLGFYWRQQQQRPNHAFDCRVYNMAALDFFAYNICVEVLELDGIVYDDFWKHMIELRAA